MVEFVVRYLFLNSYIVLYKLNVVLLGFSLFFDVSVEDMYFTKKTFLMKLTGVSIA